jgi:putative addiction module component (TIGR02574 family)
LTRRRAWCTFAPGSLSADPLGVSATVAHRLHAPHIASMAAPRFDFSKLGPAERLELVEQLWDSLTPDQVPLTAKQAEELDRREALHQADPGRGRPWREVLDEIERRRG